MKKMAMKMSSQSSYMADRIKNTTKLKLVGFLYGVHFHMPIISLYFLLGGASLQSIVISQTLYSIFSFLGELPTGIFADKFGQKLSIIMGYLVETIGLLVMFLYPNIFGLYLAYSLIGIAEAFLSGSQEALFYESVKEEKQSTASYQKEYGAFLSNVTISFAVTTFISGLIVSILGIKSYPYLILVTTICFGIASIIVMTLKDFKATIKDAAKGVGVFHILKESVRLMRHNKTIFTLIALTALTLSGEYFLYGVYQPYFEQNGVPPLFLGLVLSFGALLNYFIVKNAYRLERFLPFEKITLLLNLPIAVSFILMAIIVHPIFLIALFILMKGLFESQAPIISDYVNEYTSSNIRSTVLSGMSLTKSFFQIILRLVLAVIIGGWGVQIAFLTQGFYLIIGVMIAYWVMVKCGCTHKISKHYLESDEEGLNKTYG